MPRLFYAFLASVGVSLGLFWGMQQMVSGSDEIKRDNRDMAVIDFVRLKQDTQTQKKERHKKEPPKPKKPQIPKDSVQQQSMQMQQIPFHAPDVSADLSLANNSFLGDAVVGMGFGDSDVIPLYRAPATYPQRAMRQKIEGFVTAKLTITPEGTVDNVEIIDANPKGVFEREAIRALYRYKFKPKIQDGKAVTQEATQTIEFKLGDS